MKLLNAVVTALCAGGLVFAYQKQTEEKVYYQCSAEAGSAKLYSPERGVFDRMKIQVQFNNQNGQKQNFAATHAPHPAPLSEAAYTLCKTGRPTEALRAI